MSIQDPSRSTSMNLHTIAKNLYDISRQLRLMNDKLTRILPNDEKASEANSMAEEAIDGNNTDAE